MEVLKTIVGSVIIIQRLTYHDFKVDNVQIYICGFNLKLLFYVKHNGIK